MHSEEWPARVYYTEDDDDGPLAIADDRVTANVNVTCRSVGTGAQLLPWCLFVSLYVTPEGFEPSRHELDQG